MRSKSLLTLLTAAALCAGPAYVSAEAPTAQAAASAEAAINQEFQRIEDAWSNSVNSRDQYGLELVLSPLFIDISSSGDVSTRNQQLAQLISSDDKSLHYDQKVIMARRLGDVAIVNGTYELRYKGASGPMEEHGVFTHVFQKSRNSWFCLSSQRTLVRENAAAKANKSEKNSKSESSFHIPFFK